MTTVHRDADAARYACPRCHRHLDRLRTALECPACGASYRVEGGIPDFVDDADVTGSSAFYEAVFDRAASIYESPLWYPLGIRLGSGASLDELVAWVLDRVERDDAVVDAPTGTGVFAREIATTADTVDGVDIADGMLRRAQRVARHRGLANYRLARARVERLPFADDAFDAGVCTGALYLLDDPVAALTEIERTVAAGGHLVGMTVVDGGPLASRTVRRGYEAATGIDVTDVGTVEDWLDAAGYGAADLDRRGAILLFDAPVA